MENETKHRIERCRLSGSKYLVSVLSLGCQELTGVFPKSRDQEISSGPLEIVWCPDSDLVQLAHSYAPTEMYGEYYGYRSGLNRSMVEHLTNKIRYLERLAELGAGDTVIDIGSNDCTSLKAYDVSNIKRVGIDPTGLKFKSFYPDDVLLLPDFFSADVYRDAGLGPAKIITSIAMFYDVDDPIAFARNIEEVLMPDGLWHFEQSYMPSMLRMGSYDTICHEHVQYYSLTVIQRILAAAKLKILDVHMNAVNGGSFAVTAIKQTNPRPTNTPVINWLLEQEERMGLRTSKPYRDFEERAYQHRNDLVRLLEALVSDGKKILGYGASTKGNVVLQFCGITEKELPAIAEVNPDKFGCFTPGSNIPIVSEADARAMQPDYFLVLPWHFKDSILRREKEYLDNGGKLIFPLPEIEIICS